MSTREEVGHCTQEIYSTVKISYPALPKLVVCGNSSSLWRRSQLNPAEKYSLRCGCMQPGAYPEMTALYPAPGKGMGIRYLRVSHRRTEKLSVLFSLKRAPCQSTVLAFNTSLQLNSTGTQRASSAGAALIKSLRILQTSGAITSICDYTRDLWAPRARIDTQNNNVMCSCAPAYPQDCCCCR